MTMQYRAVIHCDHDPCFRQCVSDSPRDAEDMAKRDGWAVDGIRHLCWEHCGISREQAERTWK